MAISDYRDREPKDKPWQRPSKKDEVSLSPGLRFKNAGWLDEIAKALGDPEWSEDRDFYRAIDELIARYKKLAENRNGYRPDKQRRALRKFAERLTNAFEKLPDVSKKRLLLALGKRFDGAKGAEARMAAGRSVFDKIKASVDIALNRTANLPRGDRGLEDEHWLTKKLATLMWEHKGIKLSNATEQSASGRETKKSDLRPRQFLRAVFARAGVKINDSQLDTLIRTAVRERKKPKRDRSADSDDSDNAE